MNRQEVLREIAGLLGASLAGWTTEEPDLTELDRLAGTAETLARGLADAPPGDDAAAEQALIRELVDLEKSLSALVTERRAELDRAWADEQAAATRLRTYGNQEPPGTVARYLDDLR